MVHRLLAESRVIRPPANRLSRVSFPRVDRSDPVSERSQAPSGTRVAAPNGSIGLAKRWIERGVQAGAALSEGYRAPPLRDHRTAACTNDDGLAQRWIDVCNSHDASAVVALFTPDVFYEDVPMVRSSTVPKGSVRLPKAFSTWYRIFDWSWSAAPWSKAHGCIEWVSIGTDVGIFRPG
ncbi:MAG: hypothetical protein NVS1B4_12200 [Gemmatimonadaceae bacterium]